MRGEGAVANQGPSVPTSLHVKSRERELKYSMLPPTLWRAEAERGDFCSITREPISPKTLPLLLEHIHILTTTYYWQGRNNNATTHISPDSKNNASSNHSRFPSPPPVHTAATLNTTPSPRSRWVLRWKIVQFTFILY
jgi:hypothetical protein